MAVLDHQLETSQLTIPTALDRYERLGGGRCGESRGEGSQQVDWPDSAVNGRASERLTRLSEPSGEQLIRSDDIPHRQAHPSRLHQPPTPSMPAGPAKPVDPETGKVGVVWEVGGLGGSGQ